MEEIIKPNNGGKDGETHSMKHWPMYKLALGKKMDVGV